MGRRWGREEDADALSARGVTVTPGRPVARLRGVEKRFGRTVALDGAELTLYAGEVHGVLGENGAGKTTLLNVLGGLVGADAGTVEVVVGVPGEQGEADADPRPSSGGPRSPREAWSLGIGMVHQHFALVPTLTVLENLALGHRGAAGGWRLPFDTVGRRARKLMEQTRLPVPLDARVEELGVGDRQRVEILKALLRDPRILVLDEPTAVLTPGEVSDLFRLLRELAAQGRAVALVAHKLDEVLAVADRVTVMRRGRTVLTAPAAEEDAASLTRAMVGAGGGSASHARRRREPGAQVGRLEGVRLRGRRGAWAVDGVDLRLNRGEILGIAGVEGNGQRELALCLAGVLEPDEGSAVLPAGVGFVPQDRSNEGLVGDFDLVENMALALHRDPSLLRHGLLRWDGIRGRTRHAVDRFSVKSSGLDSPVRALSGGNQQRLVVAREFAEARDLLVVENPSRGLDVNATAFVHEQLREMTDPDGAEPPAVVLISTDLDEVLELSDRLLVMVRGRLIPVPEERRLREVVGSLMLSGEAGPPDGAGAEPEEQGEGDGGEAVPGEAGP